MAKRNKKKKKHRFFWFFLKFQIVILILLFGLVAFYYLGGYAQKVDTLREEAHELVANSDSSIFVPSQTVSIYDSNNNLISQKKGSKLASYVNYEDIPAIYVTAIISIEDKKFYSHNGVDIKGLARALFAMVKNAEVTQGGSTITMQLAKLIYMDASSKDWQYKIKQIAIATELEKIYSKNKIMEFYLNNIYFANGYYGISAASRGYFNKDIDELDLSQVCFLLAIPNSPSRYDPVVNPDNTITRRNTILQALLDDKKISESDYKKAVREEIALERPEAGGNSWNNYVDTYTYYCATKALMKANGFEFKTYFETEEEEKEYQEKYDELFSKYQKELYSSGYSIYTSIDMEKQYALQNSIDNTLKDFDEKDDDGVYKLQSSGVCINNETGLVTAIVGGRSQDFNVYTLNRAYQSHRQPGSSIKPLIVYTPCFERGYTKDSKIDDHKFEGGPKNASGSYYGEVNIEFAVQKSLNTVAWQLYEELTPTVGLQYLKNMNYAKILDSDYVTATCLGGFTKGVSALEMASGYATLANDGIYREPSCVRKIIDAEKNVVYSYESIETIVYTETASRMMTEVLSTVFKGTAKGLELEGKMPAAVKTGTTNDMKDGWFCGYTRYYTTAIWVGYDMPKKFADLNKKKYPGHIWKSFMDKIHEGLTPMDFPPPAALSDDFNHPVDNDNPTNENEEEIIPPNNDSPEEEQEQNPPEEDPENENPPEENQDEPQENTN